jgi:hypothetical protein
MSGFVRLRSTGSDLPQRQGTLADSLVDYGAAPTFAAGPFSFNPFSSMTLDHTAPDDPQRFAAQAACVCDQVLASDRPARRMRTQVLGDAGCQAPN